MDDLIVEFLTETNESLAEIDLQLVNLEQNPNDKDLLGSIFRLMHTIKGTCGFLGLPRLETCAHRAENVMGRFRDGTLQVTPDYVTLIFESIDRIKYIIGELEANGKEPDGSDADLIEKLDAVYEGRDQHSAAPAPVSAEPVDPLQALWDSTPGPADPFDAPVAAAPAPVPPHPCPRLRRPLHLPRPQLPRHPPLPRIIPPRNPPSPTRPCASTSMCWKT